MSKRKLDGMMYGQDESFQSDQYKPFHDTDIEILLQPSTIKKYIENLQKVQSLEKFTYYPATEEQVKVFSEGIRTHFNYMTIKYYQDCNLDIISRIISYIGKSGINYIKNVEDIDYLNKPTLLFYGIEQLATFYSYLNFNLSNENSYLKDLTNLFWTHGLDPFEFKNITSSANIEDLLNYRIKLTKKGAAQRFFFVLGFPVSDYFFRQEKFSLLKLIYIFIMNLSIGVSHKLQQKFLEDFSIKKPIEISYHQDLDLLIFYCLSFLFSHLSRYKIFTWQKLLHSEEKELGFFIRYIIKRITDLFYRKIFSIYEFENAQLKIMTRQLQT